MKLPYRHYMKLRKQAGDTIVEVMIAVAVISSILVGAFYVSSRSGTGVRDAEEHAQALQFLQGQVEFLRSAASRPSGLPSNPTIPFCLDASGWYRPVATDSHCLKNNLFIVSIVQSPTVPPGPTTTFDLSAQWNSLQGNTAQVGLSYKVEVAP